MESSFAEATIKVLVCSANVGNAEPTPESIAAWIPNDGDVAEVTEQDGKGTFTVIVIGMQEASFEVEAPPEESSPLSSSTENGDVVEKKQDHAKGSSVTGSTNQAPSVSLSSSRVSDAVSTGEKTTMLLSVGDASVSNKVTVKESNEPPKAPQTLKTMQLIGNVKKAADGFVKGVAKASASNLSKGYEEVDKVIVKTTNTVTNTVRSVAGTQDATQCPRPILRALTQGEGNECNAEQYGGDTACLFNLVKQRLPSYRCIVNYLRGQMRMMILVRSMFVEEVTKVECKAENTGLGQVLANKGGIVATMTIRGTHLGFISAHLAAHEGEEYYRARNASIQKILGGAKVGPQPQFHDSSLYNHHTFLCGDLNYRVKMSGEFERHEDHVAKVFELIEKEDWRALNDGDELASALLKGDCLSGFQTPYCEFNPTFKLKREPGFVYNPQRTPSYTDRILWRSLDGLNKSIENVAYHPCPGYTTSDHKPIRGAFEIKPCNTLEPKILKKKPIDKPTGKSLHIFVSDMSCRDLEMSSEKGDPYILFTTNPLELLVRKEKRGTKIFEKTLLDINAITADVTRDINSFALGQIFKKSFPKTKTIHSTTSPDWGEAEIRFELTSVYDRPSKLKGTYLYLNVVDDDPASDDLVGTTEVNIMDLAIPKYDDEDDADPLEMINLVDRPILKNGIVRGYLTCEISAWWFSREVRVEDVRQDSFQKAKSARKKKTGSKRLGSRRECSLM